MNASVSPWRWTARELYAGGDFTTAGGASANYIAKWNGAAWSALGSGMDGTSHALAVDGGGNLYAGGGFTTAGGVRHRIAKWDGATWSALGSGMDGYVYALAVDGGATCTPAALHHRRRGERQQHRQMGRHGLVAPGRRHGNDSLSTPWRWMARATSTPGAFHHSRRGQRQPHRQVGRHGLSPLGSGMEGIGLCSGGG